VRVEGGSDCGANVRRQWYGLCKRRYDGKIPMRLYPGGRRSYIGEWNRGADEGFWDRGKSYGKTSRKELYEIVFVQFLFYKFSKFLRKIPSFFQ